MLLHWIAHLVYLWAHHYKAILGTGGRDSNALFSHLRSRLYRGAKLIQALPHQLSTRWQWYLITINCSMPRAALILLLLCWLLLSILLLMHTKLLLHLMLLILPLHIRLIGCTRVRD